MKGSLISVSNMISYNGNEVPNQFIIHTTEGIYFQSYQSIIAFKSGGKIYLDENKWDHSKTTGKYRNIFLREEKKDTLRKIKEGKYILCNLNKLED